MTSGDLCSPELVKELVKEIDTTVAVFLLSEIRPLMVRAGLAMGVRREPSARLLDLSVERVHRPRYGN